MATATPAPTAVVLFSGPGGVCQGLTDVGVSSLVGVENEANAVATARAAGHAVVEGDVRAVAPSTVANGLAGGPLLLQASPPCQGLSQAGRGGGRGDLAALVEGFADLAADPSSARRVGDALDAMARECADPKSPLMGEVLRWVVELAPEYVMLEQVPAALPVWRGIADVLTTWGYATWAGYVTAEQYGVPQTRKRAVLLASRTAETVGPPPPTHSRYHSRTPTRIDPGVPRWVSMAEALGWGVEGDVPDLLLCPTNLRPHAALRPPHTPAPTMAFGHETPRWVTPEQVAAYRARVAAEVAPRVNNQSGTEFDLAWPADRPSPVIATRKLVTMPGSNANRFQPGVTKSRNDGIRVTPTEAGILQSFPADYPWQGPNTKRYQQVGNAVPPGLQAALTRHLLASG